MFKRGLIAWALFAGTFLAPGSARAFIDDLYILPADPVVGDVLTFHVHVGGCDGFFNEPGFPQISQVGNTVRVLYFSAHIEDPEFCNRGDSTGVLPIGVYAEGAYTFVVARLYSNFIGQQIEEDLGTFPVVVSPVGTALAMPVPIGNATLSGLCVLLAGTAWTAFRRRTRCQDRN